ncbi:protein of unknown function (plasmid) [Cupriavidus taiwanensis]|nr:protein of unknown function [Cupriavidus taiwanensis]SOZ43120.1 protein of unknown function [Cupriavidus taiwanensis]SPD53872.1 protein of unknown function [Cupriavidus taiwanensis]
MHAVRSDGVFMGSRLMPARIWSVRHRTHVWQTTVDKAPRSAARRDEIDAGSAGTPPRHGSRQCRQAFLTLW